MKELINKDFITIPPELNKRGTLEEFEQLMKFDDKEIPIDKVEFLDYPDIK